MPKSRVRKVPRRQRITYETLASLYCMAQDPSVFFDNTNEAGKLFCQASKQVHIRCLALLEEKRGEKDSAYRKWLSKFAGPPPYSLYTFGCTDDDCVAANSDTGEQCQLRIFDAFKRGNPIMELIPDELMWTILADSTVKDPTAREWAKHGPMFNPSYFNTAVRKWVEKQFLTGKDYALCICCGSEYRATRNKVKR